MGVIVKKNKVFIEWIDQKLACLNTERLIYEKDIERVKEELERVTKKIEEVDKDIESLNETKGELNE